ncbi:unnamed protein product [Adineta steineri]|uniref:RING-type domain-containing protein n=3 Tax=Adineta steineri TaxID=433720 RepID=A0A819BPQ4_9BILA|nr:unnamed protein product [Adineta steineri]CAF3805706.1 unnamed protein product [Adineta steineri]
MSRYHPYSRNSGGRHYSNNNGAGDHAPHINFTHVDGDIKVVLKKVIQSGVERSLLLTPEKFFEISHKSDDIVKAGKAMADYHGKNSETQPPDTVGPFKFILRSDFNNDKYEHMYEWEVPNSQLRVSIRNRRSDGKRPKDTQFVVEVRIFGSNGLPTDDGVMMAWHNFNGTFVHNRRERKNRIEEMRRNGVLNLPTNSILSSTTSTSATIYSSSTTTTTTTRDLPSWTISENHANKTEYSCVTFCLTFQICMDTYSKGETVNGLPQCTHFFHCKCIQAWLVGSNSCPTCRSIV